MGFCERIYKDWLDKPRISVWQISDEYKANFISSAEYKKWYVSVMDVGPSNFIIQCRENWDELGGCA